MSVCVFGTACTVGLKSHLLDICRRATWAEDPQMEFLPVRIYHWMRYPSTILCTPDLYPYSLSIFQIFPSAVGLSICRKPVLTKKWSWQIFLLQKDLFFVQVVVKLLVTLIYSFSKLDIRMSAGYRNIYSTESLGCIAIEVKSGYCNFTGQSIFNLLRHDTLRQRE